MSAPTIVFDLDGTLVDTAPDLIATLNVVFAREGYKPVEYESSRALIGGGARVMIERGLKSAGHEYTPALIERLFTDFIAYYGAHVADRSRPFPGLEDALDALARRDCRLAVCTNKLERLSLQLLESLGLRRRFAVICGQDTFGIQKPDPEVLRRTIAQAGGRLDRAIMVGDSLTDIHTARAAGIPVVAVNFGYSERPISEFGPDRIIGHFAELPAAIADLDPAH